MSRDTKLMAWGWCCAMTGVFAAEGIWWAAALFFALGVSVRASARGGE